MWDIQRYWLVLENHYYWINWSAIKYDTRNICAESTAIILEELWKILFPSEEIEIYVIPAKEGCHQDTFWLKNKDELKVGAILSVIWWILILPWQISQIITDNSSRELNNSQIKLNKTQEALNLLQIKKLKAELNKSVPENTITDEQYQKVIASPEIKKHKNRHFEQLQKDSDINKETIIVRKNDKISFQKTILRKDFLEYIEDIPKTNTIRIIEKIHHLTVIKSVNDEEYKWLMWLFEDIQWSDKFYLHMSDEEFYTLHLQEVFGLKSLIARVKYTLNEDQDWILSIKNKEIILVYQYNWNDIEKMPDWETISIAPLKIWNDTKDDFKAVEKENVENKEKHNDQLSIF